MAWLREFFRRCQHKWAEAERYEVLSLVHGLPRGAIVVLRCQHCGDMKRVRV